MSATTPPTTHGTTNGATGELREWRDHARVFLQPIAAPSILGLYGFAAGTFMVTANLVGWFGNAKSPLLIFPFAVAAGGIAQGAAALFAYKARDGLATAIHGIWAAFWLGYGFLNFMIALHLIPAPAPHAAVPELGYWFFALAAITLVGMFASLAESLALTSVLAPLWVGSALLGVFYILGGSGWEKVGGYVTMASAFTAFYAASAMMLASTYGRVVLPTGKYRKEANVPGGTHIYPIQFALGEPGVKQGQ
ncbi:MAG TPA: GPR1/FUN34/YaaH family transporter [Solirubrobacteraceae bacterium]|nr:GPR1/FUN34/YaaH family transporter [Solirubrobacteraceae bacterium]